jgi:L-ribulose-5-phosphate 3-epimerase
MSAISIGVLVEFTTEPEPFQKVREVGGTSCQLVSWRSMTIDEDMAKQARANADAAGIGITTFWCGYSGPCGWNYEEGPATIGLIPEQYRAMRTTELKKGADIASWLGVKQMATHVGFLPMDPQDKNYLGAVAALKDIVGYCQQLGITFCFETGQETPMVLRRCISDIGLPNLGVNLDPANLLMYGNANPVDALDLIGPFVRDVHAKDGEYPTDGLNLGAEKPLGEGRVNYPALVAKLKSLGYVGALTIEREISGPQQEVDIKRAIETLRKLI